MNGAWSPPGLSPQGQGGQRRRPHAGLSENHRGCFESTAEQHLEWIREGFLEEVAPELSRGEFELGISPGKGDGADTRCAARVHRPGTGRLPRTQAELSCLSFG